MERMQVIQPESVHDTTAFAYSHAVRVGNLVFVAGEVARDRDGRLVGKGNVRAQTEQVFANLRAVLEAAGSGLDRVAKVTVFTTKLEYRPIIHEVRARVFQESGGILPASTLAVVSSLADPDWLVEIEAIAAA